MVGTNGVGWLGLCIAWGTAGMALAGADEGPFRELSEPENLANILLRR